MPRVMLFGGGGFIGSSLVDVLLSMGHEVVVADVERRLARLDRFESLIERRRLSAGDFNSLVEILAGVDRLIALKWSSTPASSMTSISSDARENIGGHLALFDAVAVAGSVQQIIFLSSGGAVYGNPPSDLTSEEIAPDPISAYGISKVAVEQYLKLYSSIIGIPVTVLRLSNPYGPYQFAGTPVGVISAFLRNVWEERQIDVFGDGSIIRDYIFIEDAVYAIAVCLDRADALRGVFNVGSGRGVSINDLLGIISGVTGIYPQIRYQERRSFDVQRIVLDVSRFRGRTGWAPRVSIQEGVETMWRLLCNSKWSSIRE